MLGEEEKERRWEELISNKGVVVESKEEGVRSKEKVVDVGVNRSYLSDLWLLMILMVFWVLFGLFMEFV